MKHLLLGVMVCLVSAPLLHGQQRPTLGPSQPSLNGPSPATTTNSRRLVRVRRIYIEPIDNRLSGKIIQDLSGSSMVQVVDKPEKADAILRGTCFRVRRLKRLHSEVFLSDRVTGNSIWQDVVFVTWDPPTLNKAVDKSAAEIVTHLFESIRRAQQQ